MSTLPGFWHAAARMTGRIDFSLALQRLPPSGTLQYTGLDLLVESGIPRSRAGILRQTSPIEVPCSWVCLDDAAYPEILRALPYAPPVLFYRGALERLEAPALAIVGARKCTASGQNITTRLSRRAATAGLVVVSGLAQGIDSSAHMAAPDRTIAVLGQGLSSAMSWGRRRLAEQILTRGGLLVSEFLPHFPASRWTFPQRNRVIAGLSRSTLVVEATRRSGALITARHALDAGREVLAVPGHPSHPLAQGCLQLLRDGAQMIASVDDLEDVLGLECRRTIPLTGLGRFLDHEMTLEELVQRTGRPVAELHTQLLQEVLMGTIQTLPGNRFIRVRHD